MAATSNFAYLFDDKQRKEYFSGFADRKKEFESQQYGQYQAQRQNEEWQMNKKAEITNKYKSMIDNPNNLDDKRIYDLIKQGVTPENDLEVMAFNNKNLQDQNKFTEKAIKDREAQKMQQEAAAGNVAGQAGTVRNQGGTAQASQGNSLGMNQNQVQGLKSLLGA